MDVDGDTREGEEIIELGSAGRRKFLPSLFSLFSFFGYRP